MDKASILIIDDDENIHSVVGHYLEDDGYIVFSATTGAQALEIIETKKPGVILLDLGLPDIDGLALMNRIRAGSAVPIIVVSGKGDATDKVVGLEMGADDYIGKPFHLRELSARIKTVLRRGHKKEERENEAETEIILFGEWIMDPGKFELKKITDQTLVDLTTGEFRLLQILAQSAQRVLSRKQLFDMTRQDDYDSFDRAVDIQIGRLRKKLNDNPKSPRFIKTVRGVGYMFIADTKKGE